MGWAEQVVATFEEFVGQLIGVMPSTSSGNQLYWFRGQSSNHWRLEPSFTRCLRSLDVLGSQVEDIEQESLKAFQSRAHLFVSPPLLAKVRTTPCWWALMQHHGAPTRLLDWTVSPYVAAYFAVQHNEAKADGAVWCFCSNILRDSVHKLIGTPPDFDAPEVAEWYRSSLQKYRDHKIVMPLEFPYPSSDRIAAQQGRFTMCFHALAGHDCLIEQTLPRYVRKLLIPHDKKSEFLLRLREMNITGSALFPGVDGLGQSVRELVDLRAHYLRRSEPTVRNEIGAAVGQSD
jgi:hypothetical protein